MWTLSFITPKKTDENFNFKGFQVKIGITGNAYYPVRIS